MILLFVDLLQSVFVCLLYFFITFSFITLLLIVNTYAISVVFEITIKRTPAELNVMELVVVPIITILSNDFNNVVNNLYFLYFFLDLLLFLSK